jgi:fructoselysine-6-P-deglycase FrlB-like protein
MPPDGPVGIGDRVSFRISDVFLPEPEELLTALTSELEANGVVVEFSDSGSTPRVYALVRITTHQVVLLPVVALRVVS